jgi:hypothetical protein
MPVANSRYRTAPSVQSQIGLNETYGHWGAGRPAREQRLEARCHMLGEAPSYRSALAATCGAIRLERQWSISSIHSPRGPSGGTPGCTVNGACDRAGNTASTVNACLAVDNGIRRGRLDGHVRAECNDRKSTEVE